MQNNLNFQKMVKTRKALDPSNRKPVKPAGKTWERTDKRKMVD